MPPTEIVSFGFRHRGGSPNLPPNTLCIDVRLVFNRNPFHDKKLRYLRGDHPDVQADIRKTPGFSEGVRTLVQRAHLHNGPLYLGCTGGHHRSVFLAILLGDTFGCPVRHLDYDTK